MAKAFNLTADWLLAQLEKTGASSFCVGLSGGLDSVVLLHLCKCLFLRGQLNNLRAIHINHGLSMNAEQWSSHCVSLGEQWSVPVSVFSVQIEGAGQGLEDAARAARYEIFADELQETECLLLAHHAQDQAETLLYRLFRGAGVEGLTAMPVSRSVGLGTLFRPLLQVNRQSIAQYAEQHGLEWVDDESNDLVDFDRNYLRHEVLPAVLQRWPKAISSLTKTVKHCTAAADILHDVAMQDMQQVVQEPPFITGMNGFPIYLPAFLQLTEARQSNVIRYWLQALNWPKPSTMHLAQIIQQLNARPDASPQVCWGGVMVRRYKEWLFALPAQMNDLPETEVLNITTTTQHNLSGNGLLMLSSINNNVPRIQVGSAFQSLHIIYREQWPAGKKFSVARRSGKKTLKRWLQEFNVVPWLRDRVPLVVNEDGHLIAAAGFWVVAEFAAQANESGWKIDWQPCLS
ncbi:tRNA lysidine(34) synthetase TilS [Zooshikella harenae]|uniref:tRNA(Ile)-lysidine synthase n=1 Tax=Zooshikella harenae TaxID=2827238 RepID=A0ABS5Z6Y6_9GAMM|nr:tRNA lysidine(34) synthetase TilS [Zooshikella harenae]MBU2709765.1 tRNA lysidine(34) synthetase TilS [Zooshikella harenae]